MSQSLFDIAAAAFVIVTVIVISTLSRRIDALQRRLERLSDSQQDHYTHHAESLDKR